MIILLLPIYIVLYMNSLKVRIHILYLHYINLVLMSILPSNQYVMFVSLNFNLFLLYYLFIFLVTFAWIIYLKSKLEIASLMIISFAHFMFSIIFVLGENPSRPKYLINCFCQMIMNLIFGKTIFTSDLVWLKAAFRNYSFYRRDLWAVSFNQSYTKSYFVLR